MVVNWAGPPAMISLFRKMYGSHSCPDIVRRNHFNNFQHYFLQKALVVAMSKQRNIHGICPPEILKFVLDLFKYNDNSRNKVCYWDTDVICSPLLLDLTLSFTRNISQQPECLVVFLPFSCTAWFISYCPQSLTQSTHQLISQILLPLNCLHAQRVVPIQLYI